MSHGKILLFFLIFRVGYSQAQIADRFSDGEFTANPNWQGDVSRFVVSGERLKLQAPAVSGSAYLSTSSEAIYEAVWEFNLQLDFTPSSTNYAKIYLVADKADLSSPLNGYFVKVGNTTREVSLYRQTGSNELELIDGLDDRLNQPQVILGVRVTRDEVGNWELYTDAARSGIFNKEGAAADLIHGVSTWVGVQCVYTSTRSDKFWFDDIRVTGTKMPDLSPPSILRIESMDASHFQIVFSEPLEKQSVLPEAIVVEGRGHPAAVVLQPDLITVLCTLSSPLQNGLSYSVQCSAITDLVGNSIGIMTAPLLYFRPGTPEWKSVLITEIFADPSPQVGLPNAEYVELFNASEEPFDLKNWKLTDENSTGVFPSMIFLPGAYAIVTSSSSAALFDNLAVIGLPNFPSLNNSGDQLRLSDDLGRTIDSLNYLLEWYHDEDKQQGGWSLELIDRTNPCGEGDNWTASEASKGGTPGEVNSVATSKPDLTPPLILSVQATNEHQLSITANESLLASSARDLLVTAVPEISAQATPLVHPGKKIILIELEHPLQVRTAYEVRLEGLRDCNGNLMAPALFAVGLPEPVDSMDLVISEVLFNPRAGGVDFVEIYNASDKFIDLSDLRLRNDDAVEDLPAVLVQPNQEVAITSSPEVLQSHYPSVLPRILLKASLPTLPDDEGTLALVRQDDRVLDKLAYDHRWHSPLMKEEEGVSLERVDIRGRTQQKDNWMSGSSQAGYATPGLPNSQSRRQPLGNQSDVYVFPEVFASGSQPGDFVQIHYRFDTPGSVGTVHIYSYMGDPVKRLVDNELLGTEGFFRWDGDCDDGRKARAGYYVVRFEVFDPGGYAVQFLRRVVVAAR